MSDWQLLATLNLLSYCLYSTFILNPGKSYLHDVWTSHLRGQNLALGMHLRYTFENTLISYFISEGANRKALFIQDIDNARSIHILDTQSDVFAVEQQEVCAQFLCQSNSLTCSSQNLVYTGARNGSISRFDTRLDYSKGQRLLDEVFNQPNSVTHLNIVRDWQLLVGNMNGSVSTCSLSIIGVILGSSLGVSWAHMTYGLHGETRP